MLDKIRLYIRAYRNKVTNKIFGIAHVPHIGRKCGRVLLSFITGPFTLAPGEYFTDPHSNYWVAEEIARLFAMRGYDVDVINWNNTRFIPRKKYAVCVDMQYNMDRLAKYLGPECIKVMHLVSSHPKFQNDAELSRIANLESRRGVKYPMKRTEFLDSNPACADFIGGYGNRTVHGSYARFGKKITPIPVPIMEAYAFPENKDFASARKHFLWFGGGGAILKGLDLVIETFASLPELKLTMIGPAAYEKEFEETYSRELSLPNIKRYGKPRFNHKDGQSMTEGRKVIDILNKCGAIIGLSASEGGGGATVQAMQAGLYPIVTPQTGIREDAPSVVISDPTVENIKKAVLGFSNLPADKVKDLSRQAWTFASKYHSKESFTRAYESFMDTFLKNPKWTNHSYQS